MFALTLRAEERGVAGLVAVRLAVVLGVAAGRQGLVALLAAQARRVPVLAQGGLALRCDTNARKKTLEKPISMFWRFRARQGLEPGGCGEVRGWRVTAPGRRILSHSN